MRNAKKSDSFVTAYCLKRKELIMKNLKVTIGKTTKVRSFASLSKKEKTAQRFKRVKNFTD